MNFHIVKYFSPIFSNITDEETGNVIKRGLFGYTAENYRTLLNQLRTEGISSVFSTPLEAIDESAVRAYNDAIASDMSHYEAYTKAAEGANLATRKLLESAHGAEIGQEQIKKATEQTTLAFKAQTAAVKLGTVAFNALASYAIMRGIQYLTKVIYDQVHAVELAKDAMRDSVSEYQQAQTELNDVNSELVKISSQMDELSSKDSLTLIEKEQLEDLKATTKELELQKLLKEEAEKESRKKAAEDSSNSYKKQFGKYEFSKELTDFYRDNVDLNTNATLESNNVSALLAAYMQFNDLREQALKDGDTDLAQLYFDNMDGIRSSINKVSGDLLEQKEGMQDYYNTIKDLPEDELTTSAKNIIENYIKAADAIALIQKTLNPDKWNSTQISGLFSTEDVEVTKEELIEMAKKGILDESVIQSYSKLNSALEDTDLALEEGQTAASVMCEEMKALAEEAKKAEQEFPSKPYSTSKMISEINSLSEGFEALDKIMASQKDKDNPFDYTLLDDKNFTEKFSGLGEAYTNFHEKVASSPKDVKSCQSAYDDLVTAYLNSSGIIDGLSDETAVLTANMLKNMGVSNAEEVVMNALAAKHAETAAQKYWEANATHDLADATIEEYVEFLNEADASDATKQALAQLELAKLAVNKVKIDTASDIDQVINLANAAGASAEALAELERAKAILAKAETSGLNGSMGDLRMYEEAQKIIEEIESGTYQWKFNLDASQFKGATYDGGTKTNGSSSKDKKSNKESKETFNWMERMLEIIDNKHEKINNFISDETQSLKAQETEIENLIALDKQRLEVLEQQVETYRERWLKLLSELDEEQLKIYGNGMTKDKLINRIVNGEFEIQDFVLPKGSSDDQQQAFEKLTQSIQDLQSAYKDIEDMEKGIDDTEKEIEDHQKERYEKRVAQIQAENEALESRKSIIQADLDLIEATGGIELEGMYENLIDLSKQQMEVYEKEVDAARDRISEVKAGSAEYYQLQATIADCEKSIKECQAEQAEWNETIKRLPIERIQKYINMLHSVKSDLQNFIDEQNAIGIETTADQYQQLMEISQKEIDKLLEQQEALRDILGDYQYGSEKFNDVQEEIQGIDDTISGLIQNMHEWNNSILNIPINNLEKVNEQLNLYSSAIGEVIEYYDTSLNAVTGAIDDQVSSLEDLKEAVEDAYDAKIDPLNEELDLINKNNEAREKELAIEQALYDLDKANNQKSTQVNKIA